MAADGVLEPGSTVYHMSDLLTPADERELGKVEEISHQDGIEFARVSWLGGQNLVSPTANLVQVS